MSCWLSAQCAMAGRCYNAVGGMVLEPVDIARLATEVASEKQAVDVVILDVRPSCSFSDYFVVCTGESERQLEAVWDAILDALKANNEMPLHKEGSATSGWMLADYGAVVIHIFAPEEREYYHLEQLWKDAVQVLRIQ